MWISIFFIFNKKFWCYEWECSDTFLKSLIQPCLPLLIKMLDGLRSPCMKFRWKVSNHSLSTVILHFLCCSSFFLAIADSSDRMIEGRWSLFTTMMHETHGWRRMNITSHSLRNRCIFLWSWSFGSFLVYSSLQTTRFTFDVDLS